MSLLSHNEVLKAENEALKVENNDLMKRVAFLKRKVAEQVADSKRQVIDMNKKITKLAGWESVLSKKMLDECRKKFREILVTSSLTSTKYGVNTPQYQGSQAAHDISEDPGVYASIVCKMTGAKRDRLLNVFKFAFGASAETLNFEDDLDGV
ncbi:hypothetical protein GOP47_0026805 [Adiantum capillus-veneris]|nr:hypothetical protein GOP47_0026805 [Adiantum capillus-veneris]